MSRHERPGPERDLDDRSATRVPAPARPVAAGRNADILSLQSSAGNRAVARMLATDHDAADGGTGGTTRRAAVPSAPIRLSATIRRADHDAEPGADQTGVLDPNAVTATLLGVAAPAPEAAEGQTVRLPDIVVPQGTVVDTDAVGGAVAYNGTVTQSGAVDPFGATSWATFTLTGITVTPNPGVFTVAATLDNPITFNVASGGRADIPSETAGALTNANWATAASDLTPDMTDLGGRPPRTQFWAQDLTIRHERFHAVERQGHGRSGTAAAQAWLTAQNAGSVADIQALLAQVPGKVIAFSQAAMPYPAKEERAYGDGAPAYRARADAIRAKGAHGDYP
ncbi:hypothetical protein [Actinoplanes subtropicus]|uniref:hypothetical protein n=1 Tax=Actinoplanes subtropicus TaxID=543632 RepID=UPI0004C4515A|nr:hypothetical protein [Actinoplanes subtropicus]